MTLASDASQPREFTSNTPRKEDILWPQPGRGNECALLVCIEGRKEERGGGRNIRFSFSQGLVLKDFSRAEGLSQQISSAILLEVET